MQFESEIAEIDDVKINSLVQKFADKFDITFNSLLDVGSSDRPVVEWFNKWRCASGPKKYTAVEVDQEKVRYLKELNINVKTDLNDVSAPHDLTFALEVIEHINEKDSVGFLKACEAQTQKLFALTTPNFEYWNRFRPLEGYKECRWIPDHALDFKPGSSNPHAHQQELTPKNLSEYMRKAFPPDNWDIYVYRAWPWAIRDLARNTEHLMYFKLFAVAQRRQRH